MLREILWLVFRRKFDFKAVGNTTYKVSLECSWHGILQPNHVWTLCEVPYYNVPRAKWLTWFDNVVGATHRCFSEYKVIMSHNEYGRSWSGPFFRKCQDFPRDHPRPFRWFPNLGTQIHHVCTGRAKGTRRVGQCWPVAYIVMPILNKCLLDAEK